jgi:hypothetical protein
MNIVILPTESTRKKNSFLFVSIESAPEQQQQEYGAKTTREKRDREKKKTLVFANFLF